MVLSYLTSAGNGKVIERSRSRDVENVSEGWRCLPLSCWAFRARGVPAGFGRRRGRACGAPDPSARPKGPEGRRQGLSHGQLSGDGCIAGGRRANRQGGGTASEGAGDTVVWH